jgi:hypothetical protein
MWTRLIILLFLSAARAWGGSDSTAPSIAPSTVPASQTVKAGEQATDADENVTEEPITWMDESHAYATDQVQALTEWMDNFFGDPNYLLEQPESLLRVQWRNQYDQQDGYAAHIQLAGKLQLPKISKRLNLFFGGEEGDDLANDERKSEDRAGLLYTVDQRDRSRVDLTLDFGSHGFQPGVRFRNQGSLLEDSGYRFTQQLEYKLNKGFFTTSELNLDTALSGTDLLRLSNQVVYGEETEGAEWQSILSLNQRRTTDRDDPRVVSYFVGVNGVTDPEFVKNYRLGVLFRRQLSRRFLFAELEPAYNFRKKHASDQRRGAWSLQLNFEVALERDLRRTTLLESGGVGEKLADPSQQAAIAETPSDR